MKGVQHASTTLQLGSAARDKLMHDDTELRGQKESLCLTTCSTLHWFLRGPSHQPLPTALHPTLAALLQSGSSLHSALPHHSHGKPTASKSKLQKAAK